MGAADHPVWFVGDLDDPWVASIADALPDATRRIACTQSLPEAGPTPSDPGQGPRVVVLHRPFLGPGDAEWLARLRSGFRPVPRVILCVGPHARAPELERWSVLGLVDAIVPEATACDTIARHVEANGRGSRDDSDPAARRPAGPRVALVSSNAELRFALSEALEWLGYPVTPARDWSEAPPGLLTVWDVPVLEADWPRTLARRASLGPLIALLGFADRALVRQARAQGASACLELPCDVLDLGHVLDRIVAARVSPAHPVPPPPASSRLPASKAVAQAREIAIP